VQSGLIPLDTAANELQ
jgi:hypothetical protein